MSDKYSILVDGRASQEMQEFLEGNSSFEQYTEVQFCIDNGEYCCCKINQRSHLDAMRLEKHAQAYQLYFTVVLVSYLKNFLIKETVRFQSNNADSNVRAH